MFFRPALPNKQHKSHVEDPSHDRPVNDRKRKFVDAELALDTEGNADTDTHRIKRPAFPFRKQSVIFFSFFAC